MNDELKPCPFCGGKDIKIDECFNASKYGKNGGYYLHCVLCGSHSASKGTKKQATKFWNKRENE